MKKRIRYNSKADFIDDTSESIDPHIYTRLFAPFLEDQSIHAMRFCKGIHNTVGEALEIHHLKQECQIDY
jgi:hypothetical protein